jgi:hypothetical protein
MVTKLLWDVSGTFDVTGQLLIIFEFIKDENTIWQCVNYWRIVSDYTLSHPKRLTFVFSAVRISRLNELNNF